MTFIQYTQLLQYNYTVGVRRKEIVQLPKKIARQSKSTVRSSFFVHFSAPVHIGYTSGHQCAHPGNVFQTTLPSTLA